VPRGFQVLARRWVVESTFGWLGRWRRTSQDSEYVPATSACVIYASMSRIMLHRLADSEV
jgi:putative transposase